MKTHLGEDLKFQSLLTTKQKIGFTNGVHFALANNTNEKFLHC